MPSGLEGRDQGVHMWLVFFCNGVYQIFDRMLQVEDQLVVSSEPIHCVAVAEVVEDLKDPLRTLDPEQNLGPLVDLLRFLWTRKPGVCVELDKAPHGVWQQHQHFVDSLIWSLVETMNDLEQEVIFRLMSAAVVN